jgi:hypothetical protein
MGLLPGEPRRLSRHCEPRRQYQYSMETFASELPR